MDRYKIIGNISSGAHGVILKAVLRRKIRSKETERHDQQNLFAIKRMFIRDKQLPLTVIREIKCLQLLSEEETIISLLEYFVHGNSVNLVLPLLPTNLTSIIYDYTLTEYQKQSLVFMLLQGVQAIHSKKLIHRDLKPSNCLIDSDGRLKICDFGQGRIITSGIMSHSVGTRWYRSPELLYGADKYDNQVDLWSAGCIISEIFLLKPLFSSDSDIKQLFSVISCLGNPDEGWAQHFPDYNKISFDVDEEELKRRHEEWKQDLKNKVNDEAVLQIILSLVRYTNRVSAEGLLSEEIFKIFIEKGLQDQLLLKPTSDKHLLGPPKDTDDKE